VSKQTGTVIVIGGGVIGTACAYYLNRAGWKVTVIDKGVHGMGCSHANCGFVCPSHVLPLAEPGAIGKTLKALWQKNSPFKIKPRMDMSLWSWLLRFARRCNAAAMMADAPAIQALLASARSLYDDLMKSEPLDCEWQTRGLLFVFKDPNEMEHYAETARLLNEHFHVTTTRYNGAALVEVEPALKPGLAGGWHCPGDAHLRPDKLLSSWGRVLEAGGVTIHEQCAVKDFLKENGRARALVTSVGNMPADAFVVATGAWTPFLKQQLGCRIPIQPGKGYSMTMQRPARCPSIPLVFHEYKVAVTPMQSGYRLGSTMEFAGYDSSLKRERLELLREAARHYLHEPYCAPVEEEWFGWRPMTYDSKPIIDRSPAMSNVIIAAGHNMLGVSMAPATGKLVAELLCNEKPHIDPVPYSVQRF
jgi:D-amino-acid dehydrogenase